MSSPTEFGLERNYATDDQDDSSELAPTTVSTQSSTDDTNDLFG